MAKKRRFLLVIASLLVVVGSVPLAAQEAIALPEPTGEYAVGYTTFDAVDSEREEMFTEDADDMRELVFDVYYPAQPDDGMAVSPYVPEYLREPMTADMQLPLEAFDNVQSHAYGNAPVDESGAPYPVVVFSPGMGTLPLFYSTLLQDLASHGYVVASVWHPYSTGITVLHDGRVITASDNAFVFPNPDTYMDEAARVGEVWVGDVQFVLDELARLTDEDVLLGGHLDIEWVGVMGHSFGGAAVAEAAARDERIDAVITMDGSLFGESAANGVTQPFLFMGAEPFVYTQAVADRGVTEEQFNERQAFFDLPRRQAVDTSEAGYWFVYARSVHNNYTPDFHTLVAQQPDLAPLLGTVDGAAMTATVNAYVVGFFDTYLEGEESQLFAGDAPADPNVTLEGGT